MATVKFRAGRGVDVFQLHYAKQNLMVCERTWDWPKQEIVSADRSIETDTRTLMRTWNFPYLEDGRLSDEELVFELSERWLAAVEHRRGRL